MRLFFACHPLPVIAVTALATGLALARDRPVLLVALAVLAGQLSIGWCDDAVDAAKDLGRKDKPVASGQVSTRTVWIAAAAAFVVCVPLSLAVGVLPGLLHVLAVASGWAYALWLERTVASFLPYVVSFALLPLFVDIRAPWWMAVAGALLGVGAHLANVLPDIERDAAAGVRGLPQRLGATWTRRLAPLPATFAVAVLVAASPSVPGGVALAAAVALAVLAILRPGRESRLPFLATIATAALAVGLLLLS